jgi:single-strand DNA-binding protein
MRDVNSLNKVILIGHLGQNPELRYIPQTERAVANFTLATNERIFNPNTNESDIRAEWHRIVVWGKLAEFCEKYLAKGKQILLEGRLKTEKWQDRDGNQRYTTKVHAYSITMLGKRDESISKEESFTDTDQDFSPDFRDDEAGPVPEDDDEVPF